MIIAGRSLPHILIDEVRRWANGRRAALPSSRGTSYSDCIAPNARCQVRNIGPCLLTLAPNMAYTMNRRRARYSRR